MKKEKEQFYVQCKLTCLGGSEKGTCPCQKPTDCQVRNHPKFSYYKNEAETRMIRAVSNELKAREAETIAKVHALVPPEDVTSLDALNRATNGELVRAEAMEAVNRIMTDLKWDRYRAIITLSKWYGRTIEQVMLAVEGQEAN